MNEKLFYNIGEVAEMLGVNTSLLRYWESEFDMLKPRKNRHGTRSYTASDIELLKRILYLTKERGFTLEGAREQLKNNTKLDKESQLTQTLTELKIFLSELKQNL